MTKRFCDLCGEPLADRDAWTIEVKPTYGAQGLERRRKHRIVTDACASCTAPVLAVFPNYTTKEG